MGHVRPVRETALLAMGFNFFVCHFKFDRWHRDSNTDCFDGEAENHW